ncbi:MAG TPA: O-antigen ligase family protein, partial [Gemmatimonadaceae bacterium]
ALPAAPARQAPVNAPAWQEQKPDALMYAVGLMMFAYIWRVQDAFPILGKLQLPLLGVGLAVILFASTRHPWRRAGQIRGPLPRLTLGLLAVMLVGVPTSLWPGNSLNFALKSYVSNLLFMGLLAASVRSLRDVEWYAKVNLYGGFFYAMMVNVFFRVGPDGRLGNLVYYDANDFALVMVVTVPFAVYLMKFGRSGIRRTLGLIALGLFLFALVKSGSRGGFIGMVAVLTYVLLRYRAIPSATRLAVAVVGILLTVVIGSDHYWEQMSTILHPTTDYNWTDPQGRREVWKRGFSYAVHNPVLGVGVAAYPMAEGTVSEIGRARAMAGKGFKWSVAHNSFLETAAELGVPGLVLFVALFVVSFRILWRIRDGGVYGPGITIRETALAQLLIGALLGFGVGGIFVSAEYFSYLYFLLGMVIGLDKVLRLRRDAMMAPVAAWRAPAPMMQAAGARALVSPGA